jgi:hypothetical protein
VSPARLPPGTLLDDDEIRIKGVVLDHGTPCLALAFEEKLRVNVWSEGLKSLQLGVGPWLNEAKRAVRWGAPDDSEIIIRRDLSIPLGVLKQSRCVSDVPQTDTASLMLRQITCAPSKAEGWNGGALQLVAPCEARKAE